MIELQRDFRILKDYAKHIESVIFLGYKTEAEVHLNNKIDKEAFTKFQSDIKSSNKLYDDKISDLLRKIKTQNDEIFLLK